MFSDCSQDARSRPTPKANMRLAPYSVIWRGSLILETTRWSSVGLSLVILAACAGPTKQQEMAAAQTALLGEAMAYRRCMESNQHLPERCRAEYEVYEKERTAFEATYGKGGEAR